MEIVRSDGKEDISESATGAADFAKQEESEEEEEEIEVEVEGSEETRSTALPAQTAAMPTRSREQRTYQERASVTATGAVESPLSDGSVNSSAGASYGVARACDVSTYFSFSCSRNNKSKKMK